MHATDSYNLQRFIDAQDPLYEQVLAELGNGRKNSHWMWFIFPQVAGLGVSSTSRFYAIGSLAEARAYLAHPVLGARLAECAGVLLQLQGCSARDIFGGIDAQKLQSSMTLFVLAARQQPMFQQVLDRYFGGEQDHKTLELVS